MTTTQHLQQEQEQEQTFDFSHDQILQAEKERIRSLLSRDSKNIYHIGESLFEVRERIQSLMNGYNAKGQGF